MLAEGVRLEMTIKLLGDARNQCRGCVLPRVEGGKTRKILGVTAKQGYMKFFAVLTDGVCRLGYAEPETQRYAPVQIR